MTSWPPDLARHLPAWAGGAALAAAVVLAVWITPRWQAEAAQATAAARQARVAAAAVRPAPAAPTADRQLEQALPPSDQLPGRIRALLQAAQQRGLRIDSVRQQPALRLGQGAGSLQAERVPLRLAGSGPYGAWRQLAADALQQDDALVLAELRLSRSSPAERQLSGTLHWMLLQQPAATTPAASAVSRRERP